MEHTRIDEGVKRGPRKPGPKPSSPRRHNGQFVERLPNDPDSIRKALEAYQAGATLEQIGTQYSVSKQAVYGWLLGGLGGNDHELLVTRALTARIANADDGLETATNPLDLSRAREQARNARLDLERRRPALYGQKQEVTHNLPNGPLISISLANQTNPVAQIPKEVAIDGDSARIGSDEQA